MIINMNSLNLRQVCGGDTIKQADFGSELAFELLDEQYVKFRESLGESAKVILKKDNTAIYQKSVPITQNTVLFKFDKILPVGSYVLEIIVGDYVFPSNNRVIITIEQTYGDFEPEYLVKVTYEELKAAVEDVKTKIEQFENTLNANETNVNQELLTIGQTQSELVKRVEALERKEDKDTIYDDSNLKSQIVELQTALNTLVRKRPPMSFYIDRSDVTRKIAVFDNGCMMINFADAVYNYFYGYPGGHDGRGFHYYNLPGNLIKVAIGIVGIDSLKEEGISNAIYYCDNTKILNPIYDSSQFNFDELVIREPTDKIDYKLACQRNFVKIAYEIGALTEAEIIKLGAVKK